MQELINMIKLVLVGSARWLKDKSGDIMQALFLLLCISVTSITTGFGLHIYLNMNMEKWLAMALTIGLTLVVASTLLMFWHQFIKKIRQYGPWQLGVALGLLIFLPAVFIGSTWWSVVGIGGGKAYSLGLRDTSEQWRKQVRSEAGQKRRNSNNLVDMVGGVCDVTTELEIQELDGGISGWPGRGTLTSSYARLKATTCELEETLRADLEKQDEYEQQAIDVIDNMTSTLRSSDDPKALETLFISAQSEIESLTNRTSDSFSPQALSLLLTQAKPPQEAIDRCKDQQKESLIQLASMVDELQTYLGKQEEARTDAGTVFTLSEIQSPEMAVFIHFKEVLGIWGVSLFVDFVPLILLFLAGGGYYRRKKQLPSVIKKLEETEGKLDEAKGKLDTAQADLDVAVNEREEAEEAAAKEKRDQLKAETEDLKNHLEDQLGQVRDSIQQAEQDLEAAKLRGERQEQELAEDHIRMQDDAKAEVEALEEEASEIQHQIEELERKRKGLEDSDPTMLAERLAAVQQLRHDLEQELKKANADLRQAKASFEEMVNVNIGQQDDIKALERETDELNTELTVLRSDLASEQERLAQTKESLEKQSARVAKLSPRADRADDLEIELAGLRMRFADSQTRVQGLESELTNQGVTLDKAHADISELERIKARNMEELRRLDQIRRDLEQQVANLKRGYSALEAVVVIAEPEIDDLHNLEEVDDEEFKREFNSFDVDLGGEPEEPPINEAKQTKSIVVVDEEGAPAPIDAVDAAFADPMDDLVDAEMGGEPDPDDPSRDPEDESVELAATTMVRPSDLPIPPPSADAPDAESIDTSLDETSPQPEPATKKKVPRKKKAPAKKK